MATQTKTIASVGQMSNPTASTKLLCLNGGGVNKLSISDLQNNINPKMLDGKDADHIGNVGDTSQDGRHFTSSQGWIRVAESTTLTKRSFTGLLMVTLFYNSWHGEAFTLAIAGEWHADSQIVAANTIVKSRSSNQSFDKVRIGMDSENAKAYIDLHYEGSNNNGVRLWAFGTFRTYKDAEVVFNPSACVKSVEFNI